MLWSPATFGQIKQETQAGAESAGAGKKGESADDVPATEGLMRGRAS
jgi:hypothetical protein